MSESNKFKLTNVTNAYVWPTLQLKLSYNETRSNLATSLFLFLTVFLAEFCSAIEIVKQ